MLTILASVLALVTAAVPSAHTNTTAASVAGKWNMSVDGGPHGNMTMGLTLKQENTHVSGTFASPHGDLAVDGEFAGGTLKLSTTEANASLHVTFEAKLKDDDTLDGFLSSEAGDMRWTAQRVKDKQ
jgi:opacity protein-like surface antigen